MDFHRFSVTDGEVSRVGDETMAHAALCHGSIDDCRNDSPMHHAIVTLMFKGAEKFPHQYAVFGEEELQIIDRCIALKDTLGMIHVFKRF
jgi:hypothetical protein